jgi:hypothetical protein
MNSSSPEQKTPFRVNDRCEEGFIFPRDRERCTGIVTIHARCEPPCPRKAAAQEWLNEQQGKR